MLEVTSISGPHCRLAMSVGPAAGPPLLFLHGVTRRRESFLPVVPAFVSNWHVHALDFRGHGESERCTAGYLTVDYAADAIAVLERFNEPAFVYGHSMGAMVAADIAAQVPDRVRAIVMEDPPFHAMGDRMPGSTLDQYFSQMAKLAGSNESIRQIAARMAEFRITLNDGSIVRVGDTRDETSLRFQASCVRKIDPAVMQPIVAHRWLDGYDVPGIMSRVKCPALLLQADPNAGGMLATADAEQFVQLADDCIHIAFEDVGHLIHWQKSSELLRYVLGFLETA